jgi:hypothetical protein
VAARREDGSYWTWTADTDSRELVKTLGFVTVQEALSDTLKRARL